MSVSQVVAAAVLAVLEPLFCSRVELVPVQSIRRPSMPARSRAQQKAAGAALSAKRGDTPVSELKGAARQMYDSMSERQLEEFAETSRQGLPEHHRSE